MFCFFVVISFYFVSFVASQDVTHVNSEREIEIEEAIKYFQENEEIFKTLFAGLNYDSLCPNNSCGCIPFWDYTSSMKECGSKMINENTTQHTGKRDFCDFNDYDKTLWDTFECGFGEELMKIISQHKDYQSEFW